MTQLATLPCPAFGTDGASGSDGVLVGGMTATALGAYLLEETALACLCITDDGGLYVNETTPANEATADDVEIVGATIAANDAIYIGHATVQFGSVDIQISTQGDYTDLVGAWQYWNGTAWTNLSGVSDGTTGWEAAAGVVTVSFTVPGDWATNTVDSVLGYWIRYNVTSVTATVIQCLLQQIWVIAPSGSQTYTDDTTDMNDADASDAALIGAHAGLNDACYFGHATEKFCKIRLDMGTAGVHTLTLTWEYWDGDSWESITTLEDKSASFTAGTDNYMISFVPPADWTANTAGNGPNGEAGFFIRARISAFTSVTTPALATQAWVFPMVTGASGVPLDSGAGTMTVSKVSMTAQTISGTNNDSIFLIVNTDTGAYDSFTWTQAEAKDEDATVSLAVADEEEVAIVQIQEDGTTEFAGGAFYLQVDS